MEAKDAPSGGISMKLVFFIFGVGSLLAWNSILAELGFFSFYLKDINPNVSFSFLNFFPNILFQFVLLKKKDLFPMKKQLIGSLIASILLIIVLPLLVINLEKNSTPNLITSGVLVLFFGLVNAFTCSGFYSLISFFPLEMIVSLSTGQGFAGLIMNIIQYIVLLIFNSGNEETDLKHGALIFFFLSSLILLLCLILLIKNYNSDYFKYYLKQSEGNIADIKKGLVEEQEMMAEGESKPKPVEEKKDVSFCDLFQLLQALLILGCFLYIMTMTVYPGAAIAQELFGFDKFKVNTVLTLYNLSDTIGRFIINYVTPTKQKAYIIIIGRTVLIITTLINCASKISLLTVANLVCLGITNGMGNSLCFGLAPSSVPDELKGRAGTAMGFISILGLFLGSCCAFPFNMIVNKII